jgi:multidrug efflux pump subunit AcrA (membrane-fusion protein)
MADPRPLEPLSSGGSHDRRRPGRWAAATAGVLVVAVGGWQAADAASAAGPSYRTAVVGRGNVDETISSTGTIASVTSSSLSFAMAGRVASVLVAPGQHVAAGQVLAQLDTAGLLAQLAQDRSTVAVDQAKLAADQASETGTATPSTAAGTVTAGSTSAAGTVTAGSTTAAATAQPASAGSTLTAVPGTMTTATGTLRISPAAYSSRPSSGSPSAASAGTGALRNQITVLQAKLGSDQHDADEPLLQAQAELRSATTTCAPLLSVLGGATVAAPTAYRPPRRGIFTVEPAALSTVASAGPSPSSATSPQSSTGTWSGTGAGSGTHTDGGTGSGTGAHGSETAALARVAWPAPVQARLPATATRAPAAVAVAVAAATAVKAQG